MGMRFVSSNKHMNALRKLIAPIIWFHDDASMEDNYKFKPHATKPDTIVGCWAEDMSPYEITCPPQLRDAIINVLNLAHRIYIR
jgi:hypothetical protein